MHVAAVLDGPRLLEAGLNESGTTAPIVADTGRQLVAHDGLEATQIGAANGGEEGADCLGRGGDVRKARESGDDLVASSDLDPGEDTVTVDGLASGDRGSLGWREVGELIPGNGALAALGSPAGPEFDERSVGLEFGAEEGVGGVGVVAFQGLSIGIPQSLGAPSTAGTTACLQDEGQGQETEDASMQWL